MPSDLGVSTALGWHGDNPEKLPLSNIDPTRIQRDTISGNIFNSQQAFQFADLANTFSAEQLLKSLEMMLPGFSRMRDQITGVLGDKLKGKIPRDVMSLLERNAAERGVTLGTSGSQFNEFDELRNLGLTSLGIQNEGISQGAAWIRSIPQAPKMDFSQMFFTPQQRLSFAFAQEQHNTGIRSFNNWVDSLPSNLERGLATAMDYSINVGTSFGESWLGMFSGGGGGNFPQVNSAGVDAGGGGGGGGMSGLQGMESGGMGGFKGMGSGGFV